MRTAISFFALLFLGFPGHAQTPTTARDYYKELYNAGGLDRMADGYACFFDDLKDLKIDNFFIFGEGKHLREYMMANGTFEKLSKEAQAAMKTDFLIVRGYTKGVPFGSQDFYTKDEDSWVTEERVMKKEDNSATFRMRLDINWQTLRFRRSVEVLNPDLSFQGEIPLFGRCEKIPSAIRHHGPEENR